LPVYGVKISLKPFIAIENPILKRRNIGVIGIHLRKNFHHGFVIQKNDFGAK
jgi:hypothetical protein